MTCPNFRLNGRTAPVAGARSADILDNPRPLVEAAGRRCIDRIADDSGVAGIHASFADLDADGIVPDFLLSNAGMEEARPPVDGGHMASI